MNLKNYFSNEEKIIWLLTPVGESISDDLCLFLAGTAIWVSSNESDERVWWIGLLIGGRINSLDLS